MLKNTCDVHTHTLWSRHAYSTVEENVRAAAEQKLELIGITEHYSEMLYPTVDIRDYQFFLNFEVWPETWHGVRLMYGCEADIVDIDGHFFGWDTPVRGGITKAEIDPNHSLKERIFEKCQYVVASIHNKDFTLDTGVAANTQMYINALGDPKVLILGHTGRSGVDFDIQALVQATRDHNKLIEINEHSFFGKFGEKTRTRCRAIAEACAELGCQVSVATDAHMSCAVGHFDAALSMLEEIHFPQELIATRDKKSFLEALAKSGC